MESTNASPRLQCSIGFGDTGGVCVVVQMDSEFLRQQADRCRSLAEKADRFTKKRLLDLAAKYDDRLTRALRSPRGEEPPHPQVRLISASSGDRDAVG